MNRAVTIGLKSDGSAVVLVGPEVPYSAQRADFHKLKKKHVEQGFDKFELWTSSAGRVRSGNGKESGNIDRSQLDGTPARRPDHTLKTIGTFGKPSVAIAAEVTPVANAEPVVETPVAEVLVPDEASAVTVASESAASPATEDSAPKAPATPWGTTAPVTIKPVKKAVKAKSKKGN
jgi:hypothetical protein